MNRWPLARWGWCLLRDKTGDVKLYGWPGTVLGVESSAPKYAAMYRRFIQRGALSSQTGGSKSCAALFPTVVPRHLSRTANAEDCTWKNCSTRWKWVVPYLVVIAWDR